MTDSYFQVPPNSTGAKIATDQQTVGANTVEFQYIKEWTPPTFWALADRVAPAANKYMLTLFNTSATRKVVLYRASVYNWQTAAVTGVLREHEFRRITARTVGTTITINPMDTDDTISAGIIADSGSTGVTDSTLYKRGYTSSEEVKQGALTMESMMSTDDNLARLYDREKGTKGITLRQNEGITVKNITSSTTGTMSILFLFTDEPA